MDHAVGELNHPFQPVFRHEHRESEVVDKALEG
jgi:hypothetical protein